MPLCGGITMHGAMKPSSGRPPTARPDLAPGAALAAQIASRLPLSQPTGLTATSWRRRAMPWWPEGNARGGRVAAVLAARGQASSRHAGLFRGTAQRRRPVRRLSPALRDGLPIAEWPSRGCWPDGRCVLVHDPVIAALLGLLRVVQHRLARREHGGERAEHPVHSRLVVVAVVGRGQRTCRGRAPNRSSHD